MEIIIKETGIIKANGTHTARQAKPVICITTGKRYASCTDAAKEAGVDVSAMSRCCTGATKQINGNVYRYVKDQTEACVDALADTVEEKLKLLEKYSDIIAEMEAKEKERTNRLAKANEKYARYEKAYNKAKEKSDKKYQSYRQAKNLVDTLSFEMHQLEQEIAELETLQ